MLQTDGKDCCTPATFSICAPIIVLKPPICFLAMFTAHAGQKDMACLTSSVWAHHLMLSDQSQAGPCSIDVDAASHV
jgi:hypothetical protein